MTDPAKQLRRLEEDDEIRFRIDESEHTGTVVERTEDGVRVDLDDALALDSFYEEIKIEYNESINPVVPMLVVNGNTVTKYPVDVIDRV